MDFELGRIVITRPALEALQHAGIDAYSLIQRHEKGDWGDLGHEDAATNDGAVTPGSDNYQARVFSAYILPRTSVKVWVITEAVGPDGGRASTCILLPDDY